MSVFKTDKKDKKKDKAKTDTDISTTSLDTITKSPEKERSLTESESSPYTKVYEYTSVEESNRPKSINILAQGFTYESDRKRDSLSNQSPTSSPSQTKVETGVAFNYAPTETAKVKHDPESVPKRFFEMFNKKKEKSQKEDDGKISDKKSEEQGLHGKGAGNEVNLAKGSEKSQEVDTHSSNTFNKGINGNFETMENEAKLSDHKGNKPGSSADFIVAEKANEEECHSPKVVMTTTKSHIISTGGTVTQNIEEKVEDLDTGKVTLSTQINTVSLFECFA